MSVLSKSQLKTLIEGEASIIRESIDSEIQLQPNGFDLSLRELFYFDSQGYLDFDNSNRILPFYKSVNFEEDGWVTLKSGIYPVTFNEVITLPGSIMAIGRPRSSLIRMGTTLESAVWDAGYSGRSQSLLIVYNPHGIRLRRNARLLQLVFFNLSEETESYNGLYQLENT